MTNLLECSQQYKSNHKKPWAKSNHQKPWAKSNHQKPCANWQTIEASKKV